MGELIQNKVKEKNKNFFRSYYPLLHYSMCPPATQGTSGQGLHKSIDTESTLIFSMDRNFEVQKWMN